MTKNNNILLLQHVLQFLKEVMVIKQQNTTVRMTLYQCQVARINENTSMVVWQPLSNYLTRTPPPPQTLPQITGTRGSFFLINREMTLCFFFVYDKVKQRNDFMFFFVYHKVKWLSHYLFLFYIQKGLHLCVFITQPLDQLIH